MLDKKSLDHAGTVAGHLVDSADHAARSTQRAAHDALDAIHDASRQLRRQAQHASDSTVDYIRGEPVKAVLIAAAAGAAATVLIGLLGRSRARR